MIDVARTQLGDSHFGLIAGPCTVEYREQTLETARVVAAAGATMLRGGAFKPRTSPYSFQGLGQQGLEILAEAREETGLPIVTELMDPRDVEAVVEWADVIQIGARNMQNFTLLSEVGRAEKPVLLKRSPSASIEELLMAAEYVVKEGNDQVILCERGIKTFEQRDAVHARHRRGARAEAGDAPARDRRPVARRRVGATSCSPLARAAVAAGADGIIVEVHPRSRGGALRRAAADPDRRVRRLRARGRRARRADGQDRRVRCRFAARSRRHRADRRLGRPRRAARGRRGRARLRPRRRRAREAAERGAVDGGRLARARRSAAPSSRSSRRRRAARRIGRGRARARPTAR